MPDAIEQLLDVTIQYLTGLKHQGTRFVSLSPETRQALFERPRRQAGVGESALEPRLPAAPRGSAFGRLRATDSAGTDPAGSFDRAQPESARSQADHAVLTPVSKVQAMAELRERAQVCMKCAHLAASRKKVVFGVGALDAQLMFVGEAPGAEEDEQGEPFVGPAGQLLTRMIQAMGLTRPSVYIANILKCRPDTPGQRRGNRKPSPEEMKTCLPYLHGQIDLIQPKVMVALGATALEGLLGPVGGITRLRGQWQTYRDIPLMPTFHPSYLLRPENASQKRLVWEDMLRVMERLSLPISEKQRSFFSKR